MATEETSKSSNNTTTGSTVGVADDVGFKLILRDISSRMVKAWNDSSFGTDTKYEKLVEISQGDIFEGCPAADAIVSPANSFGFMDGGIDMAFSLYFGWQMMERLQVVIKEEHGGEIVVGNAVIIPAYPPGTKYDEINVLPNVNEGKPIKYLISAPTMRVPEDVSDTVNAYLAFRAVLRAVISHNSKCKTTGQDPIRSILCPGLGTAVGRMPFGKCAYQMVIAYETVVLKTCTEFLNPEGLVYSTIKHEEMLRTGNYTGAQFKREKQSGEIFVEHH